jgi:hypothetical protein
MLNVPPFQLFSFSAFQLFKRFLCLMLGLGNILRLLRLFAAIDLRSLRLNCPASIRVNSRNSCKNVFLSPEPRVVPTRSTPSDLKTLNHSQRVGLLHACAPIHALRIETIRAPLKPGFRTSPARAVWMLGVERSAFPISAFQLFSFSAFLALGVGCSPLSAFQLFSVSAFTL